MKSNIKMKTNIILKSSALNMNYFYSMVPYEALPFEFRNRQYEHHLTKLQQEQLDTYLFKSHKFIDKYDD